MDASWVQQMCGHKQKLCQPPSQQACAILQRLTRHPTDQDWLLWQLQHLQFTAERLYHHLPGKSYIGYLDLSPLSNAHGPVSGLPPPGGSDTLRLASQVSEPKVSLISSSVLMLESCMSASTMDAVSRHL